MNSTKTSIISLVLILFFAVGAGAVPVEEWNRTFGGAYRDGSFYVVQTPDEGFIVSGYTALNDSSDDQHISWT